jgi:hypothetical protein
VTAAVVSYFSSLLRTKEPQLAGGRLPLGCSTAPDNRYRRQQSPSKWDNYPERERRCW